MSGFLPGYDRWKTCEPEARRARVEALAQIITAQKLGLIRNPLGDQLPPDIWEQGLEQALAIMIMLEGA